MSDNAIAVQRARLTAASEQATFSQEVATCKTRRGGHGGRRTWAAAALAIGCLISGCSGQAVGPVLVSKHCWIESINGQGVDSVQVTPGEVKVGGWAADSTTGQVPEKIALQLLDSKGNAILVTPVQKRLDRPDVAAVLKETSYKASGFEVVMNAADPSIRSGVYGLSIAMRRDKADIVCMSTKTVTIQ